MTKEEKAAYDRAYYEANREKKASCVRAYREANKERIAAKKRAYREANKERIAVCRRAYYEANREKRIACVRAYQEANREKVTAYERAYKETNKERIAVYKHTWDKANPEKVLAKSSRRRARHLGAGRMPPAGTLAILFEMHDGRCVYCDRILYWDVCDLKDKSTDMTWDHIVPLVAGGTHAPENLVPACRSCNSSKGPKLPLAKEVL
jgi:5-methylcytosine-specific restriction endonuclease McrA